MSNIQMDLTFRTDVNAPLLTTVLKTLLMQGDDAANVLTVKLYSGAEEVDATGATVSGYLLREDGAKVPLSGSAAGNVVTVNLDEHCYVVAGAFGAYVRLTMGEVKRTILKIAGEIASEGDGPVVDIEEKLVTLEDIIAQMEEMVRVTEAAETATRAANNAAQTANIAAGTADNAAQTANIAAGTADNAAGRANNAAQALEDAPIPTGTVSTYQAGTSPTTPPTGTWQSTIPAVPQGQYLWTRTVQSYTNGNHTTYYSVARQGMDGSGSVASVDGVSPDARGNVPLGAVRSVNGNEPDASGNVTIEAGGGDVQTVNGVAPDEDGNVEITGENVNVSAVDQRTVAQAVGQHDQIVRSMTAAEFEALTTEQKAALYAQGVRVVAGDGASYLLNAEGGEVLLGRPSTWMPSAEQVGALESDGTAADSNKLGGKPASSYLLADDDGSLGGGLQMKLLRELSIQSNTFAAQTVSLDLSGYDMVAVIFSAYGVGSKSGMAFCAVGDAVYLQYAGVKNYTRRMAVTESNVSFEGCKVYDSYGIDSTNTNDGWCIPMKIYGVTF